MVLSYLIKNPQVKIIDLTIFAKKELDIQLNRADIYSFANYGLITKKIGQYKSINLENLKCIYRLIKEKHEAAPSSDTKKVLKKLKKWIFVFSLYLDLENIKNDEVVEKIIKTKIEETISFKEALERFEKFKREELEKIDPKEFSKFLKSEELKIDEKSFFSAFYQ